LSIHLTSARVDQSERVSIIYDSLEERCRRRDTIKWLLERISEPFNRGHTYS
jgi:hypothetical protein